MGLLGLWNGLIAQYFGVGGEALYKFGRNPEVGAVEEVLWDLGGEYPWPTSADTVTIQSTSVDDTVGGSGATHIVIQGLDADWNYLEEVVELAGTTPVVGQRNFLRVFRAFNTAAGSLGINQGDLTIKHTTSNDILAFITSTTGQTLMAVYTVPAGKKAIIKRVGITAGQGKNGIVFFRTRDNSTDTPATQLYGAVDVYQNQVVIDLAYPIEAPEKTDLWMSATSESAGTSLSGTFNLVVYDA